MSEISRRGLLKAVVPGAWAFELKTGQGIGGLSTPAKIGLVKDLALVTSGAILVLIPKERQPRSFKDKVLSFSWDQANGKELEYFTGDLADEYLRLTKTPRVTKNDLIGPGRTNYFRNKPEMVDAVRRVVPDFTSTATQWGYTHYETGKAYIDLGTLREQSQLQARSKNIDPNRIAGTALLDANWHEWGHIDVKERNYGELINNPRYFFRSPVTNKDEQFKRYRGTAVFTDTYYGFLRFEEVLNETITVRRMIEQVGLELVTSAADYYPNGIDFFPLFTSVVGIKLDDLYEMHATSDLEGITRLIGSNLPGNRDILEKGASLLVGIHQSNPQIIQQTGVYNLLLKR